MSKRAKPTPTDDEDILINLADHREEVEALRAEIDRLRRDLNHLQRAAEEERLDTVHDCELWRTEGIGCKRCNAPDPGDVTIHDVLAENRELRLKLQRLQEDN